MKNGHKQIITGYHCDITASFSGVFEKRYGQRFVDQYFAVFFLFYSGPYSCGMGGIARGLISSRREWIVMDVV